MRSSSINARLWFTYALLILLVLIVALAGIIFAFQRSPLLYRQIFLRISLVSKLLTNRLAMVMNGDWDPTIQLFFQEAEILDVKVAILDSSGGIVFKINDFKDEELPGISNPENDAQRSQEEILIYRDQNKTDWFYQISQINERNYLLAAAKRPDISITTLFQDELLKPLINAGFFSLFGAFILSWFIARWINRPLKNISISAQNIAMGKYTTVPIEGPSEIQQLAQVINNMSQKVEDSLKSQRDFVANVSHEFKTPLTSIQGFSQAINDGTVKGKKEINHASKIILDETDRLNYLVNDLLILAKMDAGTIIMGKERIEINDLIKNIIERFRFEIEKADIQIQPVYTKQSYLIADGARLAQVFSNLLDNAIKFSKPKSTVKVQVKRENDYVYVSITDFGVGISDEDQKRIFERFYQVDKSRKGGIGRGVGLGLAIARQVVEAHGGEISVKSQLGEGSTFMVKLPIEDAAKNTKAN
jgi:signal transduction histidine kinase